MKIQTLCKKVFSMFLSIVLLLSMVPFVKANMISAATYPLKVHFIDVAGDSTLIKYTASGTTHYGMIDAGNETENNRAYESSAAYFAGVADKAGNPRILDFCIITHAHNDHYIGLKYFDEYNIHVNTMYVNAYYNTLEEDGKVSLKTRLNAMKNAGMIGNIVYVSYRDSSNVISYPGGFSLRILGPILTESTGTTAGYVNKRSMMCTLDYDNYKYIFMGDVYQSALTEITNNSLYSSYLVPSSSATKVIYKIGHHGRRNNTNYDAASETAMYQYISNQNTNAVYCIANKYFSSSSTYAKSTSLQTLWYNKAMVKGLYFNTGYKKTGASSYSPISRDSFNGIYALTTTTSLGLN